jgi:hypothetical protein
MSRVPRLLCIRTALSLALGLSATAVATDATAQVRATRLPDEACIVNDFTSFDEVVMTSVATHSGGAGDVYQAICDDEDCWGFSINRLSGVNVLTTGLTPGEYSWYVCAWNGSVRRVVANLSGGAALFFRRPEARLGIVELSDPSIPESLRRFDARLDRTAPH